jgi:O-antigen/teichoic acid export membrane protein
MPMVKFFGGVAVYLVLFNALMFVDTVLLKRLMAEHFAESMPALAKSVQSVVPWVPSTAGYHADPAQLADVQVAYYAAVQNLARLSYQIMLAATFVVFPLVSRSTFTSDKELTKHYVETTARYSLIGGAAFAVVMAANPGDVLGLVYAADFVAKGGVALQLLALGNVAFILVAVSGAILNGAGHTRIAMVTAAVPLVVAIVANYIAISLAAGGGHVLEVAAGVTGGAMTVGALACAAVLFKKFGAFIPVVSVVRVAIAIGVAMAIGRFMPLHGKLMTLVEAGVVFVAYLGVLVVTRELGPKDLAAIKQLRRKRRPAQ